MPEENAVSLKLPTFWSSQPQIWFAQAEAQFALRQIATEDTKFAYLVAALDQTTAIRVLDFLDSPPQDEKYTSLKKRLLDKFQLSRRARAEALLHIGELGDRKPSELMDEMLALAGTHEKCFLFEQIFLERMPESIRLQLSGDQDFDDPRQAALKADALWLAQRTHTELHKVTSQPIPKETPKRANNPDWCYYHNRFLANAKQCRPPCTYAENGPAGRH